MVYLVILLLEFLIIFFIVKDFLVNGEVDWIFKLGDVIIGGLFLFYKENLKNGCKNVFFLGINCVEVVFYVVD